METCLHDRIAAIINTDAFRQTLKDGGADMIDFQSTWNTESRGDFDKLRPLFQQAIRAGEQEFSAVGEIEFA
jgi:hypothetical protein